MGLRELLDGVAARAAAYREGAADRPHRPDISFAEALARFDRPAPLDGAPAEAVIAELAELADGGLANMTGPRFFGWVIGATAPAGLAADWLTSAWAQNAANAAATPAASACEQAAARWLLEMMGLPSESAVGFVTGGTMANFTCLAAARGAVLRRAGWDVEAQGLFGAPPIHVVLGAEAHSTVFSALRYLGLGSARVVTVPADEQGRMRADAFREALAPLNGPIIAITQAGHINSGGFDPLDEIAAAAREKGAWLHVDGAIGLWAAVSPEFANLTRGLADADSWAGDGHKWLQTPHDCGYAIVRDAAAHRRAMAISASYLPAGDMRHPADYVPELSRRARGFSTWAMLRHLGQSGIAALVSRHCALARRMAAGLAADTHARVLNDVVLNQVAVAFEAGSQGASADEITKRTIEEAQTEGVCFVGGAQWRGREIVRVSIIGANTTEADIDRSVAALLSAARRARQA